MHTAHSKEPIFSGSAMALAIQSFDWAATPLGAIAAWPSALRVATGMVLASKFPSCLLWGPDLIALYNDAFMPILGQKSDTLGRPFRDIWREAWAEIGPIAARALQDEATFIEDFPLEIIRHGYVEQTYFTFCYSPVRDETGQVVGIMDTVVETTGKVLAENQLRTFASTLEAQVRERTADRDRMWQLSSDLMLSADLQGTIMAVNPAWTKTLGWDRQELTGHSYLDFLHPDDVDATQTHLRAVLVKGALGGISNQYRCKNGSYRWISWESVAHEDRITAVGRDVTNEKLHALALQQAEERLRQSQKMEAVGQLTGGLAHDFNNLLTGITGSLELLQLRVRQGRVADLDRYVGAAQSSAKRAAALTHRLLAFARRQTLEPKAVQINRLILSMEELVQRTAGPHVAVEVITSASLWRTLVDPNQLENALLNLCINACDAMPGGGRLVIETANRWLDQAAAENLDMPPGQYVSLSVSDSGTGMTPEVSRRAFDPFFTTKPIGMGTGLGLSMIYGFVRQSGGQARIYSEVGAGTMVSLYLPRYTGTARDEPADAPAADPRHAGQGETVLIIDDEPAVRMLVAEVLGESGYTVIEAGSGPEGLAALQSHARIDLLITDVGLPGGLNGRQVADAARALQADLKVLFITGYAENAVLSHGHLDSGTQVLTKPFAMDALASRVKTLLGN
ncbi:MAG: response regulator [Janthinobacterium lividum]